MKKVMKIALPAVFGIAVIVILALQIHTLSTISDLKGDVKKAIPEETKRPRNTESENQQNQDQQQQNQQTQDQQQQQNQQQQYTQQQQDQQQTQPVSTQSSTVENGQISAVVVAEGDSWDSRGKKATKVSLVVKNNGDQPITNWTVVIDVPAGSEIEGSWNGTFSIEGTKLTATGVASTPLNTGDTYDDAGFIIVADAPFVP